MSISNIDRGFEAIYKTYTDSSYNNIIIKETNDEPKNQLILNKIYTVPYGTDIWKKYTTTGFASSNNGYANRGFIVVGPMKYIRGNSLWSITEWRKPAIFSLRSFSTKAGSNKNVLDKLDSLRVRSVQYPDQAIDRDLYKTFILNKDIIRTAYIKLKSKPGMMTPGINPTTLDGISEDRLNAIINKLKDNSYQFTPGKRIMIPK